MIRAVWSKSLLVNIERPGCASCSFESCTQTQRSTMDWVSIAQANAKLALCALGRESRLLPPRFETQRQARVAVASLACPQRHAQSHGPFYRLRYHSQRWRRKQGRLCESRARQAVDQTAHSQSALKVRKYVCTFERLARTHFSAGLRSYRALAMGVACHYKQHDLE